MKFKIVENFEDNLFEYSKGKEKQGTENRKLKNNFLKKVNKNNYGYIITSDLTVHHLDDTWLDNNLKNNDFDNVLFINASTSDANCLHQLLHFLKQYGNSFFDFITGFINLLKLPIYKYDPVKDEIIKLSIFKAFKQQK